MINPFQIDPEVLPIGTGEQEELIELQCDSAAKTLFEEKSSHLEWWVKMASSYPQLVKSAVPPLLTFPTSYECEQGFSSFLEIKSKSRNRLLKPGNDFRVGTSTSNTRPRIEKLVSEKEHQKSH